WTSRHEHEGQGMGSDNYEDSGFGRRGKKKIQPGDGHQLKPFRWWQMLGRSLFYAPLQTAEGQPRTYAVSVDYLDWDDNADVYLEEKHYARAKLPASIPVEGGALEVGATSFGLKRMHFVAASGQEQVLKPDGASAEGLRAKLAKRNPGLSRAIGMIAVVILLTMLPIGLLQLVEILSQTDVAANFMDPFTSPIRLPDWTSTPLLVLSILAALERALTLRNHWLIDLETGWFD
ncbi:MAG: hypothetical protein ACTHWM_12605, partial [Yaniella sp.]|uniref:hypothetical protein n=1 Tax=Yaniella sp. TaxID=2773929 RepID=UPI003F9D0C52